MPWITETVAGENDVGSWSSLAVGSDNVLHVSFYDETHSNLMYARSGRDWELSTVVSGGEVGEFNALALSSRDEPRIAYWDRTRRSVGYARYSAEGGWSIDPLRDHRQAESNGPPCLALNAGDLAQIITPIDEGLMQVVEQGDGRFYFFGAISARAFNGSAALTLDRDDRWHVVYNDICPFLDCDHGEISEWIVYATNATADRNRPLFFAKTAILHVPGSAAANRVRKPAIALDAAGIVHIVYADLEDGGLKYLANAGDWAQQVLYDARAVSGASMWMDAAGILHVAFTAGGGESARLMYATNATGNWVIETIDASSEIGWVTSITVDGFAQPHVTYYDATDRNLRHAVKVLGVVERVR